MTIMRLPVFFKQRDLYFYPAWAYAIPATILKIPLSILLAVIWTSLTYYTIGYAPEVGRFFCQALLFSGVHLASISMFRLLASLFRTTVASTFASVIFILFVFIFSGFIIPRSSMPVWLRWGFWVVPLTYGEIGLATNEFLAPRWQKMLASNTTIGHEVLQSRGLLFDGYFVWVSVGALFGFCVLSTLGFTLALTFLKAPRASTAFISREKLSQLQGSGDPYQVENELKICGKKSCVEANKGYMILPFQPFTVTFQNVQYYIDTPMEMREQGFTEKKLQLLHDITGSFKPGVLTALMGVSGAGKTTLLDVLAGRKTSGTIEGEIRIGGYPKVQETFARVSGYCEQTDIHSPNITVEESLIFSAWLRLPDNVDSKTKTEFVNEVLQTIELNEVKDALVGLPGINGLSTEQRKRLTIAVELVANPSIIFMDEPTTGLDARAAAIVIRAVQNVVATGRTVVCTIHQPSIDIFEAFDELMLLKTGGRIIYSGPLGQQSRKVIEYFQTIPSMPKIKDNYNPATWMLEVTSASSEVELGINFAKVYNNSVLCNSLCIFSRHVDSRNNEEIVQKLSVPSVDSKDLHFHSRFSLSGWEQYKCCLWKQQLSYWRSPSYNLMRLLFSFVSSLIFGLLFWQQGRSIKDEQSMFTIFGSMFASVTFLGINNCSTVLPFISTERSVVYRERFAGMYSSWAYSFAQVTVELPYLLTIALIFTVISYPMIGYYLTAYKLIWYFYAMSCTLVYFNYLGMMLASLTPNYQVASIIASANYALMNLFSGFLIPKPYYAMSQFFDDEIEPQHSELAELGKSSRLSFQSHKSSFRRNTSLDSSKDVLDEEFIQEWAKFERLPSYQRSRMLLFDKYDGGSTINANGKRMIDVSMLGPLDRHQFIEKLIKQIEQDNLRLLQKLRKRMEKVGLRFPTVKIKYKNLFVDARCKVVDGKPLPTLWNTFKSSLSVFSKLLRSQLQEAKLTIIKDVSGIIKPGSQALVSVMLLLKYILQYVTFSMGFKVGKLEGLLAYISRSFLSKGDIEYNGHRFEEFITQKTSAYISQHDLHIPEMTVRETVDFSARCQGVGSRADLLIEVCKREKQEGIIPDADIDAYMKAIAVEGLKNSLQTDYILKILGLDICADTMVGDVMRRGISGGQKKRLTTGDMIVGPTKALFMDEITNGLDSSTAFQIVSCIQQLVHVTDASALIALLQPAPETFDLFDDVILMAEGKIVYHGPRDCVLEFFETCGFRCPKRKGIADFLQEVISQKDQPQYWFRKEPYGYISVNMFCEKYRASRVGKTLYEEASQPPVKTQLVIIALITMTVFLRIRMHVDILHANYYLGSLFYGLIMLLLDGFPELSMTIIRLPVFFKQRDLYFYPAWAYAIPATILKIPLSILLAVIWTSLTYCTIGYAPEVGRFFCQALLFSGVHLASISMFRLLASLFRTTVASTFASVIFILFVFIFSGFIIPQSSMPVWLRWGFWAVPLTYGEIGLATNEFLSPRWQKMLASNTTIGHEVLQSRGLLFDSYFVWVSIGALFGFCILSTVGFTLALTYLKAPRASMAFISREKLSQLQGSGDPYQVDNELKSCGKKSCVESNKGYMILPFQPLTVTFHNVQYFIDTPTEMRERGFTEKKLQLLHDITGSFKPGVLTALMGVSGAGKTTLLDVLAGRKTSGTIKGEIRIGGYPKEFVNKVLQTVELNEVRDALVGLPGVNGLSTEQRKRLTIAVELVANPSIIFMDEPTTGLDARAASIVIRAVKNIVATGRTVVCTIHQPSIDMFEAFDERSLLRLLEIELGINFTEVYYNSVLCQINEEVVQKLSLPSVDSKDLHFHSRFSLSGWEQYKSCLWKQQLSYWRSPSYNLMRLLFSLVSSLIFGLLFWQQGRNIKDEQSMFTIFGSMFVSVTFLGINNCKSVLPFISTERNVVYRERFAGMYSSWAYSFAQVTVELPYLLTIALIFTIISYPMIGYYLTAYKLIWYFYAMSCTLVYFNYLGMMLASLTPNYQMASIIASANYALMNLFSGFLFPKPEFVFKLSAVKARTE
uniref:ABC transporter domain-containing protein n=1 Tax=Chenopodium quinoa TaxID=63459 RepID=A0A803L4L5_CHEQI